MISYKRIFALMALVALGTTACGGDSGGGNSVIAIEASQAALTTTENIKNNIEGLSEAMKFLEEFGLFQKSYQVSSGAMVCYTEMELDPESGEPVESPDGEICEWEVSEEELEVGMEDAADEMVADLNAYVFVDAQIEEETGSYVTYLLNPEIFCKMYASSGQPGELVEGDWDGGDEYYEEEGDDQADCEELLGQVPVRLKFYSMSVGNVELDVLVGEEKVRAVRFQFHQNQLALELDFAAMKDALDVIEAAMASQEGYDADEAVFSGFQGVVRLELSLVGENQAVVKAEVKSELKGTVATDGQQFSVRLGAGTAEMTVDKSAKTVSIETDLGAFVAEFPYQAFVDAWYQEEEEPWIDEGEMEGAADSIEEGGGAPQVQGTMKFSLAGLSLQAIIDANKETMELTSLGLGGATSFLELNGQRLIEVDLNPDAGRSFGTAISMAASGNMLLTFLPKIDLSIRWALDAIAGDIEELPPATADETWRLLFDGTRPTLELLAGQQSEATEQWVKVVSGTLTVSSTGAPSETFVAQADQCLWVEGEEGKEPTPAIPAIPADDISDEGHPILSALKAGECITPEN